MASSFIAGGTTIAGRFVLGAVLGRGATSTVFTAHDTGLDRAVALKIIDQALAGGGRYAERFVSEARAAAALEHPHVVPVYEAGVDGDVLYIAMRRITGTDLAHFLDENGPLPVELAVTVLTQVADALGCAHRRGLVHRDVKPSNILVEWRETGVHAYLTDFGLAATSGAQSASGGRLSGTVGYVAPERLAGGPTTPPADVYSLGCVLYECLTGQRVFPREHEAAVLWAHLSDPPPPLPAHVPANVAVATLQALAKEPADRPADGTALREALVNALVPAPRGRRPGAAPPARPSTALRRRRPRRAVAAAAVVAVVAAGAGTAIVAWPRGGSAGSAARMGGVAVVDEHGRIVRSVEPGTAASALAVTPHAVWVVDADARAVIRIDSTSMAAQTIGFGGWPLLLAPTSSSVLVAEGLSGKIHRLDDHAATETGGWTPGVGLSGVAVSAQGIAWAASASLGYAYRVDLTSGTPRSFQITGTPSDVAIVDGTVWIGNASGDSVTRLDATTGGRLAPVQLTARPDRLTPAGETVWVTEQSADSIVKIDAASGDVETTFATGARPVATATVGGLVWVAEAGARTVSAYDPNTGALRHRVRFTATPTDLAVVGHRVWVTLRAG